MKTPGELLLATTMLGGQPPPAGDSAGLPGPCDAPILPDQDIPVGPPDEPRDVALERLRGYIPAFDCQGHCQASCGIIPIGEAEYARLSEATGGVCLTERPDVVASAGVPHALGREAVCPLLTDTGRCSVYAVRPIICSLWGAVDTMRCPWGCAPAEGYLSHRMARRLQAFAALVKP